MAVLAEIPKFGSKSQLIRARKSKTFNVIGCCTSCRPGSHRLEMFTIHQVYIKALICRTCTALMRHKCGFMQTLRGVKVCFRVSLV